MHVYSSMSKLDYVEHDCNIYNTKQKKNKTNWKYSIYRNSYKSVRKRQKSEKKLVNKIDFKIPFVIS